MATWVIRSKTGTSRGRKISIPACKHRRVGVQSEVITTLQRLKEGCLDALTSRFACWTKPLGTSLLLSCAGYLGYPFQNKQGKNCVENLARDVDKEETIGVVVISSAFFWNG
jgi:hypothetical protein